MLNAKNVMLLTVKSSLLKKDTKRFIKKCFLNLPADLALADLSNALAVPYNDPPGWLPMIPEVGGWFAGGGDFVWFGDPPELTSGCCTKLLIFAKLRGWWWWFNWGWFSWWLSVGLELEGLLLWWCCCIIWEGFGVEDADEEALLLLLTLLLLVTDELFSFPVMLTLLLPLLPPLLLLIPLTVGPELPFPPPEFWLAAAAAAAAADTTDSCMAAKNLAIFSGKIIYTKVTKDNRGSFKNK